MAVRRGLEFLASLKVPFPFNVIWLFVSQLIREHIPEAIRAAFSWKFPIACALVYGLAYPA